MSQKVSPILFNNTIYNNSKWYNKINNKFALNEDLQIREIINILFKNNVNYQYLFIDKNISDKIDSETIDSLDMVFSLEDWTIISVNNNIYKEINYGDNLFNIER